MSYGRGQMPMKTVAQIGAENQRRALAVSMAIERDSAHIYHDSDVWLAWEIARKGATQATTARVRLDWMIVRERVQGELDRRQEHADYLNARRRGIEE